MTEINAIEDLTSLDDHFIIEENKNPLEEKTTKVALPALLAIGAGLFFTAALVKKRRAASQIAPLAHLEIGPKTPIEAETPQSAPPPESSTLPEVAQRASTPESSTPPETPQSATPPESSTPPNSPSEESLNSPVIVETPLSQEETIPPITLVEVRAKKPPTPPAPPIPPCSEQDANNIIDLVTTISQNGILQLTPKTRRLIKIGDQLKKNKVHPFAFLIHAPKEHIQAIFREESNFKKNRILNGLEEGLKTRELQLYVPNLARVMGKKQDSIRPLIRAADWQGLVGYLFDILPLHGRGLSHC